MSIQQCNFCKKQFKTTILLKAHYNRKTSCIKDKKLWINTVNTYRSNVHTEVEEADSENTKESYVVSTFNNQQLQFIHDPLADCKLIGIPGGGKTRCIIEKIKVNFENGTFNSTQDFIILSFSKLARYDFIQKGNSVFKKFSESNVKTLHSLAYTLLQMNLKRNSSSLETVIISAIDLLENKNTDDLLFGKNRNVKVIFVDEAQDISDVQYNFIQLLRQHLKCYLILVGDPNQNIYQFQDGSDKYLLEYDVPTYRLKINYRSTQNIIDFVNYLSPHKTEMISSKNRDSDSDNDSDDKVSLFTGTIKSIEEDILKQIYDCPYNREEIAIIGPVKKCIVDEGVFKSLGLSFITNLLYTHNIPFLKHYIDIQDNLDGKIFTDHNTKIKEGHINIFTIHGSKGLEFKKVLLLNFHFNTFSKLPTERDFNIFKYLWYVGLSRSMYQLRIYVDCNKYVWPLIKDMPSELYILEYNENDIEYLDKNILKYYKYLEPFEPEKEIFIHTVTDLLGNLRPKELYNLEMTIPYTYDTSELYNVDSAPILYMNIEYSALYGMFIEKIHEYFYYKCSNKTEKIYIFFSKIRNLLLHQITVPRKYNYVCKSILTRLGYKITNVLDICMFDTIFQNNRESNGKNSFTKYEYDFYEFLKSEINENQTLFTIHIENNLYYHARDDVIKICDEMIADYMHPNYVYNIFKIVLYNYQIEHECGYLWKQDFTQHLDGLQYYVEKIKTYVATSIQENRYNDMSFSIHTSHPNIPLTGEIDIVNDTEIIDIKFTNSFTSRHVYQLLLYYNNMYPAWDIKKDLVIYNFKLGKKYTIHIDENIFNYDILQWFCKTTKKCIKDIVLYVKNPYYIEHTLKIVMCCEKKKNTFLLYCDHPTIIDDNE